MSWEGPSPQGLLEEGLAEVFYLGILYNLNKTKSDQVLENQAQHGRVEEKAQLCFTKEQAHAFPKKCLGKIVNHGHA